MFYSADILRTSSLGHSISDNAEKLLWRGKGGDRMYRSFCNKRPGSQTIKRLLLIKENQPSQFQEFSTFLCMGRCKSLGSLTSFLWYAAQLSEASILFFLILSLLRVHCRVGCSSWLLDGGHPVSFLFFFNINLLFYLFLFGCVGSSLLPTVFL